jgi:hypothetical protein
MRTAQDGIRVLPGVPKEVLVDDLDGKVIERQQIYVESRVPRTILFEAYGYLGKRSDAS